MHFRSTAPGSVPRGLLEAAAFGLPGPKGLYALSGEADLSPELYAPEGTFADTAASVASALFTEDLDPFRARALAERAFPNAPGSFDAGGDLVVVDLAGGPSGSAADYEAAFLVGLLAERRPSAEGRVLVAEARGAEGAALAEAAAGVPGLRLVLLCPAGPVRGLRASRLRREGGNTVLVALRDDKAAEGLFRALAGSRELGVSASFAGPANPARMAARTILDIAIFAQFRHGIAGELVMALPPSDGFALAAGLWAWRIGLPVTAFVIPTSGSAPRPAEGGELAAAFDRERPGVARSILVYERASAEDGIEAARELTAMGGPSLDLRSGRMLAAARSISSRLGGKARIIVPRLSDPFWDDPEARPGDGAFLASTLSDARPDAEIGGESEGLSAAVAGLLRW